MPEFVDWLNARDLDSLYGSVNTALDRGDWVVFPTETGRTFAACADQPEALTRFPAEGSLWSLALPESTNLADWVGDVSPIARRLVRRCWPGPVCFLFEGASQNDSAAPLNHLIRLRIGAN